MSTLVRSVLFRRRRAGGFLGSRPRNQLDAVLVSVHKDRVALPEAASEQLLGERVLDPSGDHAPQWASSVDLVEALLGEPVLGGHRDVQVDVLLSQVL